MTASGPCRRPYPLTSFLPRKARPDGVDGAGWKTLFLAIDEHARIAFTSMQPDEKAPRAPQFLTRPTRAAATLASHRPRRALDLQAPRMQQRLGVATGLRQALEDQVAGGLEGG